MAEPELWRFSSAQAADAAQEVVHHPPDTPWRRIPVPADREAAAKSVEALADEFEKLPPSIRGALGRATANAAQLSDDRLQGLAELLQNADDVGADAAFFLVDDERLLFGHNGRNLTLADVWGLTIPWLSEKSDNADALGRFGIGLKTLQSLSATLEAHNDYFHLCLGRAGLRAMDSGVSWLSRPDAATTVFVVPFQDGATSQPEVSDWLTAWGDAGLLFLRNLRSVTLLDGRGATVSRLRLTRVDIETLKLPGGEVTRSTMSADDGRAWLHYARNAPSPTGDRAGKARKDTTSVGVAFPRFEGDEGHVHVGLPVRPIGLPFRVGGQFDPLANRRDVADSRWNRDILGLVAALWLDAALDLFATDASSAWAAVPLDAEFQGEGLLPGHLREALSWSLMREARLAFADAARLDGGDGTRYPLGDLAYETPDLTGILLDDDIRGLSGAAGVITQGGRSVNDRWREVFSDFADLGAETPVIVDPAMAVQLLSDPGKPVAFVADLTGAVIAAIAGEDGGLDADLTQSPCVVLTNGTRLTPGKLTKLEVLLPADRSGLWAKLGIGSEVNPEYVNRPAWRTIANWLQSKDLLRRSATDEEALRLLAEAGGDGLELAQPLTNEQADALRSALESVDETARPAIGAGIGRAVRLEATVYDADGSRTHTYARPVDAYFIEKEKNSWAVAARKTPGLVWLHRRYAEDLRAETGRAGIGAQRLFRLLGAESVPRLLPLPDDWGYYKHYVYYGSGLWRDAPRSPTRRKKQMLEVHAQCTINDLASPDLDKVLADIAKEKSAHERRRRATALLGCLARNWDRLESKVKVTAARPDNGWVDRGEVDAWWVNSAASISWLSSGRGQPAAPGDLRLKTPPNEAMYGSDPALYLADAHDNAAHREVLTALGVEGNPSVPALVGRLVDIRTAYLDGQPAVPAAEDAGPMTIHEAADLATPFYQALAAEVQGPGYQRRIGNMQASAVRAHFDRGDGLIVTNLGWRRPSATLSGDAIFGDLAAFVPAIAGTEALWAALGIRGPGAEDAQRTLKTLSRRSMLSTDERQVMLEALRILARSPVQRLGQLRRQPVYVGGRWTSKRPVYAVTNPLLADALEGRVSVWQPGGQLTQLSSLIEPLGLTRLDSSNTRVVSASDAEYDADVTATFEVAVRNLQTDLAVSAPSVAEAISVTWEQFASFQVAVLPDLQIGIDMPDGGSHQVKLAAWLDPAASTLFVSAPDEASRARSGGYAIASLFNANPRDVAHAWVVAWSDAEAGAQVELVVTAAERAAEEKRRREASQAALLNLPVQGSGGGKPGGGKPKGRTRSRKDSTSSNPGASRAQTVPQKARTLVDIDDLVLRKPEGDIIIGVGDDECSEGASRGGAGRGDSNEKGKLQDPNRGQPKEPGSTGRGPLNYTAEEREKAGLALLRRVLAADDSTLTDVRHQPNVGADAIDDKGRYYELKVHAGTIPDAVKIEDSQIERALTTDEFYLVLVGNVEDGQGDPEVRIIHDPLHHLKPEPQGAVYLTGVLSAQVARSWTFSPAEDSNSE